MTRTVRALLINPGQPGHVVTIPADLDGMREAIGGGWIEALHGTTWHAYCDEEGRIKGLPVNEVASVLCRWLRNVTETLHGPVVFLSDDGQGDEADVPDELVELHAWLLESAGRTPAEAPLPPHLREWLGGTHNKVRFAHDAVTLDEADAVEGRRLRRIAVEILRALTDYGYSIDRQAIFAARIGAQVYSHFGYQVAPLAVACMIMSQEFLASDGKRGHSLGMMGTGRNDIDDSFDGHLLLTVNSTIVDLTAAQYSRPAQNITINGPAILAIPEGTQLAIEQQLRYQRADGGLTYYRITGDTSWEQSPAWSGSKPEVAAIIGQAISRAAEYDTITRAESDAAGHVRCQKCHLPLTRLTLPDQTVTFQHPRAWENHGHEPVPEFNVKPHEIAAICDFCDEPGVVWLYTGPNIASEHISPFTGRTAEPGEVTSVKMEGPRWGGCAICDRFIVVQDIDGLWRSVKKTPKHRQLYASVPPHVEDAVRRKVMGRWRQYIPGITRRLPIIPPEVPPLAPRSLPKVRDRLVRALRDTLAEDTFGQAKYGAIMPGPDMDDHGTLSVVASYVPPEAGRRFTERIATGLEASALYYVSSDFTALALSSAQELPDISLRPEELPAPRGLVVWEDPIMSIPVPHGHGAEEALIVGASWTTITDLGVWVVVYMRTEQYLPGQEEARLALGALMPYSTGGGIEFGSQYTVNDGATEIDKLAERTYKALLATWFLIVQPGVADVEVQTTNDKKLIKQAQRARVDPPEVRVVTLRRSRPARRTGPQEPGRTVSVRFVVRGHWKRQAYGTGRARRKTIYVAPFMKGPDGAPLKLHDNTPVVKVLR